MSCSDKAATVQDVIECVARLGWEYELESTPVLRGYDGEVIREEGHSATVRCSPAIEATVFTRRPADALLAALTAVEGIVQANVVHIRPPGVQAVLDTVAQAEQDLQDDPVMRAYAAYDADPRVNGPHDFEAFRDAVQDMWGSAQEAPEPEGVALLGCRFDVLPAQGQPKVRADRRYTDLSDRVLTAYEEYQEGRGDMRFGSEDAQEFVRAIQQHLGGTFIPPRGHPWQ